VLFRLIQRTRLRFIVNLALRYSSQAATLALGGFILLLVLGTAVLDWPWVVALLVAGLAWAGYRVWRQVPSLYRAAQRIDHRLRTGDLISTAWFFASEEGAARKASDLMKQAQSQRAEQAASQISPSAAEPWSMPGAAYAALFLLLVAGSLFAYRYSAQGTLDLRPPIASALFDVFQTPIPQRVAEEKRPQSKMPEWLRQAGMAVNPESAREESGQESMASAGEEGTPMKGPQEERGKQTGQQLSEASDSEQGEQDGQAGDQQGQAGSDAPPQDQAPQEKGPRGENEQSSLMDKLQDAMANLLSKFNLPPPGSTTKQSSQGKQASQKGQGEKGASNSKKPGQGQPSPDGEPQDSQGERSGESSESAQKMAGNQGDQSGESQSSKEANSGVGKQDGDKDLKAAEQLDAMGKLSELLGKRSQTLTGEMTAEVTSSKDQRLRTPYSSRGVSESSQGGEISRDEVPLMYQSYVQRYFEQIRKMPPAAAPNTTPEAKE
jgi:hypothetical protein